MSTSTNTKTILNFKTDKKLKEKAQIMAGKMGIPLSTIMNAFLKRFIIDKEITFSASNVLSPMVRRVIEEAKKDSELYS